MPRKDCNRYCYLGLYSTQIRAQWTNTRETCQPIIRTEVFAKLKKKRSTFVLRFLRRYREVLEHCFHSERGTTVVDEPGTSGLQTSLVQSHQGFRLSVQQVSKLQANRNVIVDCVRY